MASNNKVWSKLTVKQWQLLQDLPQSDQWEYMRSVVAIVENNGFDAVDNLTPIELRKRYEEIATQLNEEPYKPFKNTVKLGGKRYYLTRFFDTITTGQFVELSEWSKDKENLPKNLHLCVASLLVESNWWGYPKKYDGKKHGERAKLVQNEMLAVTALGLSAFFLGSWLMLLENLPTYLDEQLKEMQKEMDALTSARDLPSDTVG